MTQTDKALVIIALILGINPLSLLGGMTEGPGYVAPSQTRTAWNARRRS